MGAGALPVGRPPLPVKHLLIDSVAAEIRREARVNVCGHVHGLVRTLAELEASKLPGQRSTDNFPWWVSVYDWLASVAAIRTSFGLY